MFLERMYMTEKKSGATIKMVFKVIGCLVLVALLHAIYTFYMFSAPPVPKITYGEFPFRFEYEIEEKHYIIEDTLIAEFSRSIKGNINTNARRAWNTTFKSGVDSLFILKQEGNLTISFSAGTASYYMGDINGGNKAVQDPAIYSQPRIILRTVKEIGLDIDRIPAEEADEILAEHGIIVISLELSDPIVNSFG